VVVGGGGAPGVPDLGVNANLNGKRPFPDDNPWNTPVNTLPVDPNSAKIIASIGLTDSLHPDFGTEPTYGIPYVVVSGTTPKSAVTFDYYDESDPDRTRSRPIHRSKAGRGAAVTGTS
jgi:hypothetical protein